ncbi:MAG: M48 family metallopeptidase [Parahaliea sp.]
MTELHGYWQDGNSSRREAAVLRLNDTQASLYIEGQLIVSQPLSQLQLSVRLGSTPRHIRFNEKAGSFETSDNTATHWLDQQISGDASRFIHHIENSWLMVVAAVLTVLSLTFAYFTWGIPLASRIVAMQLPAHLLDSTSAQTLEQLNKRMLGNSHLPLEQQQSLRELLGQYAPDYPLEKLHFAASDMLGANAIALPDGTIVITDDLVALADSNIEVLAVLAHELGHIQQRHSLQMLLQGSAISVTIAMISGDISTMGNILLTLPLTLSQLHYSRAFELAADHYALLFLRQQGFDGKALISILDKLQQSHNSCSDEAVDDTDPENDGASTEVADNHCGETASWLSYLSTHPASAERIKALKQVP